MPRKERPSEYQLPAIESMLSNLQTAKIIPPPELEPDNILVKFYTKFFGEISGLSLFEIKTSYKQLWDRTLSDFSNAEIQKINNTAVDTVKALIPDVDIQTAIIGNFS